MSVEFTCPACGGTLRAGTGPVGRLVRCGGCLVLLKVPDVPPEPGDSRRDPAPPDTLPVAYPLGRGRNESPPPPVPVPPPPKPPEPGDPFESEEPAGRGRRFWVSVTLLALFVGGCGCCGLAAVVLPGPEWQEHKSGAGGFRVELPAEPRDDMARKVTRRPNQKVEGTELWTRAENFTVSYWEVQPTRVRGVGKPDEKLIDDVVKAVTDESHVRGVERSEPITVGGFPAREFEYRVRNKGTITGRVVVADSRVYVLLAGGQFTRPGGENVRRFLDSFEITDPRLQAVARQRADEAQRKGKK